MKPVCLIPARGGSKRIPRKNIKVFCGKPLISWSIECAIKSNLFSNVFVSTDDFEIAEEAKHCGAEIPFMRPAYLSDDQTKDVEVIDHFIKWSESKNIKPNIICYLYPTAPFITVETLEKCYSLLLKENVGSSLTVTSFAYPPQRALKIENKYKLNFIWEEFKNNRSQELEEAYHDAGQCYFYDVNKFPNISDRVGLLLPRYRCQDIDTLEDFEFAEMLFKMLNNNNIGG
tara:strand:+ start:1268 stop:1957 length:690 start_codon:yes stop_codon:yes gene_type:complete